MARFIEITGGDECGYLVDTVLVIVVGLLKAALDGDDPIWVRHLKF
jgi:hypothetical protein